MRKVAVAVVLLFLVGIALPYAGEMKGKNHEMTGVVVSTDAAAKTITFKADDGQEHTAPVKAAALAELPKLKAGDKVTLTCHDNEKGEHLAVTVITVAKS